MKNDLTVEMNKSSQAMALDLFHTVARRVPAYRDFLKKNDIIINNITTYDDFVAHVPIVTKENYLSQYPLADLCIDGDVFNNNIISVSSGSTGIPYFWPRGEQQDKDDTEMLAHIFDTLQMNQKKTLFVICFSMGTWIAGTLVMASAVNYANEGNPVSIVTPGIEKANAVDIVKRIGSSYEQVVLAGYPPFLKDVIEEGARAGIDWSSTPTKLIMGGESFSEEWRDYVLELVASHDPYDDSANIFGSADVGVVGYETPLSIAVRRMYNAQPVMIKEIFGTEILPSIVQFDPLRRHFEKVDDELILTSNSGIPLVRYNLKDTGGVVLAEEMMTPVRDTLSIEVKKHSIDIKKEEWPFVYLNGRKNFTITVYGVNIYPENIKAALIDPRVRHIATGKFTMMTTNDEHMDQSFELNIELSKDVAPTAEHQVLVEQIVHKTLVSLNNEFRKLHEAVGDKVKPKIRLIECGDQNYFARGVKHQWTAKKKV